MAFRLLIASALLLQVGGALARDPDGRWAASNDPRNEWYRNQISPQTKSSCCSEADAVSVDEDIRYDDKGFGHYWARWDGSDGWLQVPDEVVLQTPNLSGAPVVWWIEQRGVIHIRCYSPGPKL